MHDDNAYIPTRKYCQTKSKGCIDLSMIVRLKLKHSHVFSLQLVASFKYYGTNNYSMFQCCITDSLQYSVSNCFKVIYDFYFNCCLEK